MVVSGWQTKFNVSPGPGLWSLVLGPFGPDLGPDLGPGPELDNSSCTIVFYRPNTVFQIYYSQLFTIQNYELSLHTSWGSGKAQIMVRWSGEHQVNIR